MSEEQKTLKELEAEIETLKKERDWYKEAYQNLMTTIGKLVPMQPVIYPYYPPVQQTSYPSYPQYPAYPGAPDPNVQIWRCEVKNDRKRK
jgi:hypothetical protein